MAKINRLVLAKSIYKASSRLTFVQKIKSIGRPIISPISCVLTFIPKKSKLLDIGCGNGTLIYLISKFNKIDYAYGYDISKQAIKNSLLANTNVDKYQISYKKIQPKNFNIITLLDVIHHIPKHKQDDFLKKIISSMDIGATFIVMDINASNMIGRWSNQLHDLIISKEWVHPKKMQDMLYVLECLGLKVIHKSKHQSFWYSHYIIVAKK